MSEQFFEVVMSELAVENDTTITLTMRAADKVAELLADEDNSDLRLRVFVQGGGCSGFSYGFTFDDEVREDDSEIAQQCSDGITTIKLLIDSMSYPYLNNAEVDYVKNTQGEQFVVRNPNAETTCGCGSSFSMRDEE